jgi:hypothetical protein
MDIGNHLTGNCSQLSREHIKCIISFTLSFPCTSRLAQAADTPQTRTSVILFELSSLASFQCLLPVEHPHSACIFSTGGEPEQDACQKGTAAPDTADTRRTSMAACAQAGLCAAPDEVRVPDPLLIYRHL